MSDDLKINNPVAPSGRDGISIVGPPGSDTKKVLNDLAEAFRNARHLQFLKGLNLLTEPAAQFVQRHGRVVDDVQAIALPRGEFMLRSGEDVFSSLEPDRAPTVVSKAPGLDLYEHSNFLISTVGLDAGGDHWSKPNYGRSVIKRIDGWEDAKRLGYAGLGEAVINHYGLGHLTPEDVSKIYMKEIENHGFETTYLPFIDGPHLLKAFIHAGQRGEVPELGVKLPERKVKNFINFQYLDVVDPDEYARFGSAAIDEGMNAHLSDLGAGWLHVPTGRPAQLPRTGEGIVQIQMPGDPPFLPSQGINAGHFAYRNLKPIVQHPADLPRFAPRYPYLPVPGSAPDLWSAVEWHALPEPTWVLSHVFPPPPPGLPEGPML